MSLEWPKTPQNGINRGEIGPGRISGGTGGAKLAGLTRNELIREESALDCEISRF